MTRFLPLVFLISVFSLFGIIWIIWDVDPDTAKAQTFALLIMLVFIAIFGFLGLIIYFVKSKFNRRVNPTTYVFSCFKVSFFVALFIALLATLAVLKLISAFNLFLVVSAVGLFGLYVYLGKKKR